MKNNNSYRINNNNTNRDSHNPHHNDNLQHQGNHYEKRKQQNSNQSYQQNSSQRERSGQRNQHPDSSMGRENFFNQSSNLGAIKFVPGAPTRELPPIETKADSSKKFTGRCRLFVGNLPHNTSEDRLKALFENYGEVGEVFLGPKSAYAFIKMDTRQNAESARDALDCSNYEGRTLRVRLAAHAAAIRIKHLSPQVTNELLAYAFRYFGEIERAVVVVDDKGKPTGEGVVEYSRKQSALYAIKRCQQECFILTTSPKPVLVEAFDQQDEDEGLPEKSINKNAMEYKEQREVGPRFAEMGSFEHTFALRWKELYTIEKQKRERLDQEIEEARKNLQDQIEYSRLEHDTMQLRSKLQQLEDNRVKLQQLKEQTMNESQQRDEQRRQQDMLIRQREEDILRRQQLGDPGGLTQQETALRMQANALQNLLNSRDRNVLDEPSESRQPNPVPSGSQAGPEADMSGPMGAISSSSMANQVRAFAEQPMMNYDPAWPFMSLQQSMNLNQPPPNQPQMQPPNMFTTTMPPQQPMQMPQSDVANSTFQPIYQPPNNFNIGQPPQQGLSVSGGAGIPKPRQSKFSRQYANPNSNINVINNNRPRKRGRF